MKATASWTSKGTVTWPSLVPLSNSFGHQVEEAGQLAGPVDLLVGGQRRRGEALEVGFDPLARGFEAGRVGGGAGRGQPLEVAVGRAPLGGAALLAVLGRDRQPVAVDDRGGFGEAPVEAAFGRLRRFVEVGQQPRLEGVEQVLFDLERRLRAG